MKKKKSNIKNKYNIYLVIFLFVIIGLFFGNIIYKSYKKQEQKDKQEEELNDYKSKKIHEIQTEEKTREEVNNFVNLVFNDNTSLSDIKKATNNEHLVNYNIYYGKDSYFRNMDKGVPNANEVNIFRDKYVSMLEAKIKENFEIELLDYIITIDDAVVQRVKYKSFYYNEFMEDYDHLFNSLVANTEYKDYYEGKDVNSTKVFGDIYRIKIKALEIICSHLDDYVNKDEYMIYDLVYRKGETAVENDYLSLYMFFGGHLYEHKSLPDNEREQRVNAMINEAIKDGSLDISNPYNFE